MFQDLSGKVFFALRASGLFELYLTFWFFAVSCEVVMLVCGAVSVRPTGLRVFELRVLCLPGL